MTIRTARPDRGQHFHARMHCLKKVGRYHRHYCWFYSDHLLYNPPVSYAIGFTFCSHLPAHKIPEYLHETYTWFVCHQKSRGLLKIISNSTSKPISSAALLPGVAAAEMHCTVPQHRPASPDDVNFKLTGRQKRINKRKNKVYLIKLMKIKLTTSFITPL